MSRDRTGVGEVLRAALGRVRRGLASEVAHRRTLAQLRRTSPESSLAHDARVDLPGATIGEEVWIGAGAVVSAREPGAIEIGDHARIGRLTTLIASPGSRLNVGRGTSFNAGCYVDGDVQIGAECVISANVFMSSADHAFDIEPWLTVREQDALLARDPDRARALGRQVLVDEDCWIGWGAVIRKGVHIGRGAIIGANSVVTRDVSPYAVVGGVPARLIRQRFAFEPPASILAREPRHRPYFYGGFDVLRHNPARVGACLAGSRETTLRLVLSAQPARSIAVDVVSTEGGDLAVSSNGVPVGGASVVRGEGRVSLALDGSPASSAIPVFRDMRVIDIRIPPDRGFGLISASLSDRSVP